MNRLLSGSLLPVVFAFASFGTVACTAETAAEQAAPVVATANNAAEILAGSGGTSTSPIAGYSTTQTIKSGRAVLAVQTASGAVVNYDLLSYSFGVHADDVVADGSARDGMGARVSLADLHVLVRPSATTPALQKAVFDGKSLPKARLLLNPTVEAGMKPPPAIELAVFENVHAAALGTSGSSEAVESYALQANRVALSYNGATIAYDAVKAEATCAGACPCTGELPSYVAGSEAAKLVPGATRVDAVAVGVHNEMPAATGSDLSVTRPVLDGIDVVGNLEKGGVCAFYYAAKQMVVGSAKIAVAGTPTIALPKPFEAISWEACTANVQTVQISGGLDAAPRASISMDARGLLRTDRTIDVKGSTMTESSFGWSFVDAKAINSCTQIGQ